MATLGFDIRDVFPSGTLASHYVGSSWWDGREYYGMYIPYYDVAADASVNLLTVNDDNRKDPREFLYSVLDATYNAYDALDPLAKPTKFTMTKNMTVLNDSTNRVSFTVTADIHLSGVKFDVADE